MSGQYPFTPEKLVIGALIARPEQEGPLERELETLFGTVDFRTALLPFTYTTYYNREMGDTIFKKFWSFQVLIDPSDLAAIKEKTNLLETRFAENGQRKINLDPGILALSRFVLATTKEGSHRIPLSRGIFAEVTLQFVGGEYREQPWTYPDFRSVEYRTVLRQIREIYREQLKKVENPRKQGNR